MSKFLDGIGNPARLITGALFDCDGTLLDSLPAWISLEELLVKEAGVVVQPEERRKFASFTIPEISAYFHEHYGLAESTQAVIKIVDDYMMDYYSNRAVLLPGVAELLESCASSDVRMAVTSSSRPHYLEAGLRCAGIREYFSQVVSVDDVGASKREPKIFLYAQERLGTDVKTTWGFEDSVYAMDALHTGGFPVVGVYEEGRRNNRAAVEAAADVAISTWEHVTVEAGRVVAR